MTMTTTTMTKAHSESPYSTPAFWERLWRQSGLGFIGTLIIAYASYGYHPHVGAFFAGMTVLNLLWFAAAIRTALADAGQDGWGAATTASSAVVGGLFLMLITFGAALAHTMPGYGHDVLTAELHDLAWSTVVLSSFPRAMLLMAGTFGFWRAKLISSELFAAGVVAVVLVLLGGTTWMSSGVWAPDGAYSRFVSPVIGLVWVVVATRVLLTRSHATRPAW
jgi:hypothetical protein